MTPEGVVLDVAVPRAKCGVRILKPSNFRPGFGGLKVTIEAEQTILETAGWTVEYVLEVDVARWEGAGGKEKILSLARKLMESCAERRVGRGALLYP
jgi:hypothetical protein